MHVSLSIDENKDPVSLVKFVREHINKEYVKLMIGDVQVTLYPHETVGEVGIITTYKLSNNKVEIDE